MSCRYEPTVLPLETRTSEPESRRPAGIKATSARTRVRPPAPPPGRPTLAQVSGFDRPPTAEDDLPHQQGHRRETERQHEHDPPRGDPEHEPDHRLAD